MKKEIIPGKETDFLSFIENFITRLPLYSKSLQIQNEELSSLQKTISTFKKDYNAIIKKRLEMKEAEDLLVQSKKAVVYSAMVLIKKIKKSSSFNDIIGYDLRISEKGKVFDPNTLQPYLEIRLVHGIPEIRFNKLITEGLKIYCKRGDEKTFRLTAVDSSSPFHDRRPNLETGMPEKREYFGRFIYNGEECGHPSNIVSIIVEDDEKYVLK